MTDDLSVIERWTMYVCANCGADWGDLPASGVRQCGRCVDRNGGKRVEVVPAEQLGGAVRDRDAAYRQRDRYHVALAAAVGEDNVGVWLARADEERGQYAAPQSEPQIDQGSEA